MRKESSTNYINEKELQSFCNAAFTMSLISGRWKLTIINKLASGEKQFSTLKELIPPITERVLALQLKSLEKDGLIKKKTLYTLTPLGQSLIPIIDVMASWGEVYKPCIK